MLMNEGQILHEKPADEWISRVLLSCSYGNSIHPGNTAMDLDNTVAAFGRLVNLLADKGLLTEEEIRALVSM